MRFWLIPCAWASPAVADYLAAHPDDRAPASEAERRELAQIAVRFAVTLGALRRYVAALPGSPHRN